MERHPSKDIISSYGDHLKGKRIVLCITASVSAYKAVDLARLLMRYGAEVYPVMSKRAELLIRSELLHWATGNDVITKISSNLEHIQLADYRKSDMIIIYPCTASTLNKIANGIDDTAVTAVASVALGSKIPIIIALSMHESMYNNPILISNINRLRDYVTFVEPDIVEGKAKLAEQERVVEVVIRMLSEHRLKGKKILVTAGSTVEYIDPIRVITNKASGKFGVEIAKAAYRVGADVTLIYGHGDAIIPKHLNLIRVDTSRDMLDAIMSNVKDYDVLIMSAAVSDYKPINASEKKIESNRNLTLELVANEKIIDKVKEINPNIFLVAFKALYNVSDDELIIAAKQKMRESKADLIFVNDVKRFGMGSNRIEGFIISDGILHVNFQDKSSAARILLDAIASRLCP